MAMANHLIDKVEIDVNALDEPACSELLGHYYGIPICYIPGLSALSEETSEQMWPLLDWDACPTPVLAVAKWNDCPEFVEDVKS